MIYSVYSSYSISITATINDKTTYKVGALAEIASRRDHTSDRPISQRDFSQTICMTTDVSNVDGK